MLVVNFTCKTWMRDEIDDDDEDGGNELDDDDLDSEDESDSDNDDEDLEETASYLAKLIKELLNNPKPRRK